jgi:type I protein arginine methyltransferase
VLTDYDFSVYLNVIFTGTVVSGKLHCRKSEENPRELDVEIHYSAKSSADAPDPTDVVVQIFKVR